ncbi:MAG: AAA family ATPase [Geitlerinemataceae cyanobacterium]
MADKLPTNQKSDANALSSTRRRSRQPKKRTSRPSRYRTQTREASEEGLRLILEARDSCRESDADIVARASRIAYQNDRLPESSELARGCSLPTFRRFCRGVSVRRFGEFCEALALKPEAVSGEGTSTPLAPELDVHGRSYLPVAQSADCIGRDRELAHILAALHDHPNLYVRGARGLGKTTIADAILRHAAIAERFERCIPICAATHQSFGSLKVPRWRAQRSIDAIEREMLRHCSPRDSEVSKLDRNVLYERLAAAPTLLVIDDLDCVDDLPAVLGLLGGLPDSVRTIATGTAALDFNCIIPLQPLTAEASGELLDSGSRSRNLPLGADDRAWLLETAQGFPAAIVKALSLFVGSSGRWPRQVVEEFSEECWTGYIQLALERLDGDAQRVAATISLFRQPIGLEALAEVADLESGALPAIAVALQELNLIEYDPVRQTCIARRLERECLGRELEERADRGAIYERWIGRYCRLAADLEPDDWKVWQDYTAIECEWENWLAALEWCVHRGDYDRVRDLWAGLRGYTHLRGYWQERLRWLDWAIERAEQQGDRLAQARFWRDRAWTLALTEGDGHHVRAEADFERAIVLAQAVRDEARGNDPDSERAWQEFQSELALERTVLCLESGDLDGAQDWIDRERTHLTWLDRFRLDDRLRLQLQRQRIRADYYEAEIFFNHQDYSRARDGYSRVLKHARAIGWEQFCAYATNWLAAIALNEDSYDAAESWLRQTSSYLEGHQDSRSWGYYYQSLAYARAERGLTKDACEAARKAANSFAQIGQQSQAREVLVQFGVD